MMNNVIYKDKVYGCWTGKNIGGTLGSPFEGEKEMNSVEFYTQTLHNTPEPNDDLDLQLVWLLAIEENGIYNLTPRLLGEYWLNHIIAPWNEYSICRLNIQNGLYPPLSGSCNNEKWCWSNGAWIRSEIWACLFPGNPDEALKFAYMDACADHTSEGIYAEIFTTALESAAFIIEDIRKLIDIGLSKIPENSRIAQTVRLVCDQYDKKVSRQSTREAVVKANEDLGFFQAPGNIGFLIIGLLYGEGDFGKTICYAVNCGDDTDCTGATAGSIMGILLGHDKIPKKWTTPIGETIKTISIDALATDCPATTPILTDRVIRQGTFARTLNPELEDIFRKTSEKEKFAALTKKEVAQLIWNRSPYELTFDLPYGILGIDFINGIEMEEGQRKKLHLRLRHSKMEVASVSFHWHLPEDWKLEDNSQTMLLAKRKWSESAVIEQTITPGKVIDTYTYIELEVKIAGRNNPVILVIPFQKKGALNYNKMKLNCGDKEIRLLKNRGADSSYVFNQELFF